MESLFDYIIAVNVNKETQKERLRKRNPNSHIDLAIINRNNKFEEYKKMVDVIINNDNYINHLNKTVLNIINKLKTRLG